MGPASREQRIGGLKNLLTSEFVYKWTAEPDVLTRFYDILNDFKRFLGGL